MPRGLLHAICDALRFLLLVALAVVPCRASAQELPPVDSGPAPMARIGLYASFATLQAVDAAQTLRALQAGSRETNPFVQPFVGSPVAFVSLKGVTTLSTIVALRRLEKKHPLSAMLCAAAINAAYVGVVAHNYRVLGAR